MNWAKIYVFEEEERESVDQFYSLEQGRGNTEGDFQPQRLDLGERDAIAGIYIPGIWNRILLGICTKT